MKGRELIEELVAIQTQFNERVDRLVAEIRSQYVADAREQRPAMPPPLPARDDSFDAEPEGFHRQQDEHERPHREDGPDCYCDLPAKLVRGSKNGKAWAGYFCNRDKTHPQNCGFKKWV